ncbi:MAG: hypothetical protein E6I32_12395 [Chloroflexi bacterium]|nr:MAG: hypothetical protein E6I32_12395 [Chloroflexota bacterium]
MPAYQVTQVFFGTTYQAQEKNGIVRGLTEIVEPIRVEAKSDIITNSICCSSQRNHDHGQSKDEQTSTARLEIDLEGSQHNK